MKKETRILNNLLGSAYEIGLITAETASTILSSLNYNKIVRELDVWTENLVDGFSVECSLNLSSGKIQYDYASNSSSAIATHFVEITKADGQYRFDDWLEDQMQSGDVLTEEEWDDLEWDEKVELYCGRTQFTLEEQETAYFEEWVDNLNIQQLSEDYTEKLEEIYGKEK